MQPPPVVRDLLNTTSMRRKDLAGSKEHSAEEAVLHGLCIAGVITITPFAIYYLSTGVVLPALVTLAILTLGVGFALHARLTGNHRLGSLGFTLTYMLGLSALIHIEGVSLIYWMFPAMAAAYFLVPLRWAITFNALAMLGMLPVLAESLPTLEASRVIGALAIGNLIACIFTHRMIEHRELLTSLATRDPLTGAGNRGALDSRLNEMIALHKRRGGTISLLILDIDFFKQVNDQGGHNHGDQVLRQLTQIIDSRIRITDSLYRFGGDEFVIVLNETPLDAARGFAEALRQLIEDNDFDKHRRITVSMGVAELSSDESAEAWMQRADVALYQAKQTGRNRSISA